MKEDGRKAAKRIAGLQAPEADEKKDVARQLCWCPDRAQLRSVIRGYTRTSLTAKLARARHGGARSLVAYIARPTMVRMQSLPNPSVSKVSVR